ncbi:MAG: AAA family ATPase, partial [Anaerorhabdus sp.]
YDLSEENAEDYYRTIIMLFSPWRDEEMELLHGCCKEIYQEQQSTIDMNKHEFNQLDEEALDSFVDQINGDREANENNEDNEEEEVPIRRSAPGDEVNDFNRFTVDIDDHEEGDYHRTVDLNEELGGSTRTTYFEKIPVPNRLSKEEYNKLISSLNQKQRQYIYHVINHVRYNTDNVDITDNVAVTRNWVTPFSPLYHFVTGGAGTGKSLLIRALHQSLMREFDYNNTDRDLEKPSVLLTAFTGRAAFNIFGLTIHSAFNFPVSQAGKNSYNTLSASFAQSMSVALNDLKVVIIDEISMVSDVMFGFIDKRLRDIFNPDVPFGGRTIIVVGDFLQLPPVGASSLYTPAHEKVNDPF